MMLRCLFRIPVFGEVDGNASFPIVPHLGCLSRLLGNVQGKLQSEFVYHAKEGR